MKKSVWLPILLAIYFACISLIYASDWISSGNATQFYITSGIEIALLIGLHFALRKREQIKK